MYNQFVERHKLYDVIHPESSNSVLVGSWVDVRRSQSGVMIVTVGAIAASGTVDATLTQDDVGDGTNAKAIAGKSITQLADADDDVTIIIKWRAEELDVDGGFHWLLMTITPATSAAVVSGHLYGSDNRYNAVPTTPYEEVVA